MERSDGNAPSEVPATESVDAEVRRYSQSLVRKGAFAMVLVGALTVIVCTIARGIDGLVGALIGVVMVIVFFGIDVVVLRWLRYTPPVQVLAVVVMVYVFKITVLAIFLVTLRGTNAFDDASFAVAVIGLTAVALGVGVVLVARQPLTIEPIEPVETDESETGQRSDADEADG